MDVLANQHTSLSLRLSKPHLDNVQDQLPIQALSHC